VKNYSQNFVCTALTLTAVTAELHPHWYPVCHLGDRTYSTFATNALCSICRFSSL